MENKKAETTTCDRGHEPITFAGCFFALCPLCAAIREKAEAEETAEKAMADHQDAANQETSDAESAREKAERHQDLAEEALEGAEKMIAEAAGAEKMDAEDVVKIGACIREFLADLRAGKLD